MRPTYISILGPSRHVFGTIVSKDIAKKNPFADLIERYNWHLYTITLSSRVATDADIQGIVDYIMRFKIPRSDIRIYYQPPEADELIRTALSAGLSESGLAFGADVAEHDAGLARYFIDTASYQAVKSHRRHVVIGPKGSGKSAILREVATPEKECLVITPEHYATDVLDATIQNPATTELSAYITTWKYTLLIEIFRRIVQNGVGDSGARAEIRRYLQSHDHLRVDLSLFERFVDYLRRITDVKGKLGPAELEIGLDGPGELQRLFKMDELLSLLPALRKVLRRAEFTVFIDELDQSWNNSETANRFLVSLLTAAIQLRGIDKNLHVVVFLRSEIFDLLKPTIAQLDKLRSDIETIHWSRAELRNLIVRRAFDSMYIKVERAAAGDAASALFPGTIGTPAVDSFEYILSRTSYRPREVIQFSNLALKHAQQLGFKAILPEAVLRAEEEFSGWKLDHIISENLFIYPQLDMLLERFRGQSRQVSFAYLDSFLTDILLGADGETYPQWLRAELEPQHLLELLYRLEVLGIERPVRAGAPGSYDYVFGRPKGKPQQSESFQFHPALWQALELI